MKKHIKIFDTTLRDGEQTPRVNLNAQEKLRIAKQLESLGVDVIEAGFAVFLPHGNVSGLQTDRSSENFFRRPFATLQNKSSRYPLPKRRLKQ